MAKAINWKKAQPAPVTLWHWVDVYFPVTKNLGIYSNRNVAGTNTPSAHAEGRALDIGLNANNKDEKKIGDFLFSLFIEQKDELGLDHVIWNKQMWDKYSKKITKYQGKSPHTDHVHVAWTRDGSQITEFPNTLKRLQEGK